MKERPILMSGPMVRALLAGTKTQTRRLIRSPHAQEADAWSFHEGSGLWESGIAGDHGALGHGEWVRCPYGVPSDRLWVRETWMPDVTPCCDGSCGHRRALYRADIPPEDSTDERAILRLLRKNGIPTAPWKSGRFMPRWASRITLEVTDVRVQRLQEISEEDAKAEGCDAIQPEKWWQGYRDIGEQLLHQQHRGPTPPDWMIEPHECGIRDPLAYTARESFRFLWSRINGKRAPWDSNPWVWVISFRRLPS